MTATKLDAIAQTLSAALTRRLDLLDDYDMAMLIDQDLELRVLQNYCEQLEGLEGGDAITWILRRLATLEARILVVGGAALHAGKQLQVSGDDGILSPQSVSLKFDADLVQTGFYPVEIDKEGVPFRWLGPEPRASIFLPKFPGPIEVVIAVHSAFIPDVMQKVQLSLDGGQPVGVEVERQGHRYVLKTRLTPGAIGHSASMRLDIDSIHTETPIAKGGSDPRYLSLSIFRIDIKSV